MFVLYFKWVPESFSFLCFDKIANYKQSIDHISLILDDNILVGHIILDDNLTDENILDDNKLFGNILDDTTMTISNNVYYSNPVEKSAKNIKWIIGHPSVSVIFRIKSHPTRLAWTFRARLSCILGVLI